MRPPSSPKLKAYVPPHRFLAGPYDIDFDHDSWEDMEQNLTRTENPHVNEQPLAHSGDSRTEAPGPSASYHSDPEGNSLTDDSHRPTRTKSHDAGAQSSIGQSGGSHTEATAPSPKHERNEPSRTTFPRNDPRWEEDSWKNTIQAATRSDNDTSDDQAWPSEWEDWLQEQLRPVSPHTISIFNVDSIDERSDAQDCLTNARRSARSAFNRDWRSPSPPHRKPTVRLPQTPSRKRSCGEKVHPPRPDFTHLITQWASIQPCSRRVAARASAQTRNQVQRTRNRKNESTSSQPIHPPLTRLDPNSQSTLESATSSAAANEEDVYPYYCNLENSRARSNKEYTQRRDVARNARDHPDPNLPYPPTLLRFGRVPEDEAENDEPHQEAYAFQKAREHWRSKQSPVDIFMPKPDDSGRSDLAADQEDPDIQSGSEPLERPRSPNRQIFDALGVRRDPMSRLQADTDTQLGDTAAGMEENIHRGGRSGLPPPSIFNTLPDALKVPAVSVFEVWEDDEAHEGDDTEHLVWEDKEARMEEEYMGV